MQSEVELVLRELIDSLPGIKGDAIGENFLSKFGSKYETALVELIIQGRDLFKV